MQEEYNPKIYGESAEGKLQSAINSIREQSALLLMAVGDCVIIRNPRQRLLKSMAYQEVEYSEPCLERRNIRNEAGSTNKKEREKHQKKAL